MKVTSVEAIPLRVPFKQELTIAAPHQQTRDFIELLVLRIRTDDGIEGIGETPAWRRQGSSEVLLNLYRTIKEVFEPLILGRSPFDIAGIMHTLNEAVYDSRYPQAAVGDALYDIQGKALNMPLCRIIGGMCTDRIRVGMVLSIHDSTQEILNRTMAAYENGYRHFRIKIGIDPSADLEVAKTLRQHFGDKIVLRADANAGMHYDQALPLLKKLEAYDLDELEQPVPIWDLDGMADLARRVNYPICADESLQNERSLITIINKGAARMIQTKNGKCGGVHYTHRLWTIAEAGGVAVFPGNHPGTSISVAAVAHLCASWPSLRVVGDFQYGATDLIAEDIVKTPVKVEGGYVHVPQGPGLGLELDNDKIERFRVG